jgi:hypothetical protein
LISREKQPEVEIGLAFTIDGGRENLPAFQGGFFMNRLFFSVLLLLAASSSPSLAQLANKTKAGVPVRVYSMWNCVKEHEIHMSGTADHGTVTSKRGMQARCGKASHPVTEAWYTPEKGFRGVDRVTVYGENANRSGVVIDVTVE